MNSLSDVTQASTFSSRKSFLSRPLTRWGREQDETPKGPLGLTTLIDPGPDEPAIADVIFVHGLNGGSQSTWSKGNSLSHFWPKEWLPLDEAFQDVRIHTFGYPSAISRESVLNVHDFARSLLAAVKDSPVMNRREKPRLIFIAHSMGGLVVKKAYILGHREPEFKPVVERVCSIFFLATPHQGAAIAQTLARLLTLVPGARPFVHDLLPQSPLLQSINEDFPRICGNLQIMSFYETRPMNIGLSRALIVEKTSAVMNLPNERRTFLDADHRNVAMYSSRNDSCFVAVRNALATVVAAQRDWSQSQKQVVAQEDQTALDSFLGVSDAPEDDIMLHESVRLPGSCEWLGSKDYYRSWKESLDSRFLWLRGRPGAGKSVLASHIISDLRGTGVDCCFFFFQGGDVAKSTANLFLRSIAWQMAMLHGSIMAKIRELQVVTESKEGGIDKLDHNPVWRRLFSAILKVRLSRPQFWVIDAMDECKASGDMIGFLTRIQEQWPVSILVTCRDPPEVHLSSTNSRVEIQSHAISDDDSKQDIALFLKSHIKFLPRLGSSKWRTSGEMASQIIENSRGCFLWAALMCSDLRKVTSEKEVERVLESTPSNMDALYSKILVDMANARFGKELAKALITWTLYAFRPLTTSELLKPIEMDIDDKIDDVELAISRCCGNLVYVDANSKVQLVHLTVREFLTGKNVESEFAVTKQDGHRRMAQVCLEFLIQSDKNASKLRRPNSDTDSRLDPNSPSLPPFTDYASTFLFQHLQHVHSTNDEIFVLLSKFLGSSSLLRWVEFIGTNGDLHTVYQAGKTINSLLNRRAQHSPPAELARDQEQFAMLEKWGDDLIHLVTKFSHWLRVSPRSIYHIIPSFCPPDSAIRRQFSRQPKGISVQGLLARAWDDCLTTITYPRGMTPTVLATGRGFFAVGMMNPGGSIMVHDDSIFQEVYSLSHGEPVWRMAFAESGKCLASAGANKVRIWSCTDGTELMSFGISSRCLAIAFTDDDTILRVATKQNQLIEWDVEGETFLRDEPVNWSTDMEETFQGRAPTSGAFGPATGLMSVIYRGQNLVLWDYVEDRIYDVYEKDTGSVSLNGSHKLAGGTTTVRTTVFSPAIDSYGLAATYMDGDLFVYDTRTGSVTATVGGANAIAIASSFDGRTLASVDSAGNLTFFEFETLRVLYRVQFDTMLPVKALAFTSNNLRFVEISGEQCRVWEPTVLLRTDHDVPDDEDNDTLTVSTEPQEINFKTGRTVNITAMACCRATSTVFCATEDGSVHAYDISGEPESQQLFVQTVGCPIDILYIDEISSLLACRDRGNRTTARRAVRRVVQRQRVVWDVSDELLADITLAGQGLVKQVLVSGQHSRLLVSTNRCDTLWPMPEQGEGVRIKQIEGYQKPHWVPHPSKSEYLFRITPTEFGLYTWSDLELVRCIKVSPDISFEQLVTLQSPLRFATNSKAERNSKTGKTGHASIQFWDFNKLENPMGPVEPTDQLNALSSNVDHIVGTFGSRLIFFTTDYWIASVDLGQPSEESFVRHFFVPSDWISAMHEFITGVGRSGEILFARLSELAVIKRGLEVTETGAAFNPRRGSTQSPQASRRTTGTSVSAMPYRLSSPAPGPSGSALPL
ncbi:hypothetical protein QBC46DRAFT_322718 [Diplogelasinospora grovesii]|uniref:GPI inositol-deacylase n=1 Tax=Diplogelasinospora grovesii TaxID=303347 RepID=A0AAN6S0S3_9PEZI|nr:hypothetical protein QBC46DRAFT_322718 [Diplogelasinospora grovesii]